MDRQQHTLPPDLLVVGGGMVGAALALGAAQQGLMVTVLEQNEPQAWSADLPPEVRVSAISVASVALLQRLGVWPQIQAMRTCPYRHLETWEWEGAQTRFSAQELNLPELGYIVENRLVQWALWQALQAHPQVNLLCAPQGFTLQQRAEQRWQLTLADGRQLQPRLLAGADGAQSRVRAQAGIGLSGWQYRQSCLLVTVKTAVPQQDTTWQRFYPSGPRAFFP
ncbi:MAG: FAD-dependent oxidoreductase, partial [Plesiomonas sp.]